MLKHRIFTAAFGAVLMTGSIALPASGQMAPVAQQGPPRRGTAGVRRAGAATGVSGFRDGDEGDAASAGVDHAL